LHLADAAIAGQHPQPYINAHTIQRAIALQKFFIGQWKLIHSLGGEDRGELTSVLSKILDLSNRKGWISVRDVQACSSSFRKFKADQIRQLFTRLVEMQRGEVTGTGAKIRFRSKAAIKTAVTTVKTAVTPTAAALDRDCSDADAELLSTTAVNPDSSQNVEPVSDTDHFAVIAVDSAQETSATVANSPNNILHVGETVWVEFQFWTVDQLLEGGWVRLRHKTLLKEKIVQLSEVERPPGHRDSSAPPVSSLLRPVRQELGDFS
jgi:hypothetical protein